MLASGRRRFLREGAALAFGTTLTSVASPLRAALKASAVGPLEAPDELGLRLPRGFSARVVARSGLSVRTHEGRPTGYDWHIYPDGGATFARPGGGYAYVSNSESAARQGGGAGALVFDAESRIVAAHRILGGTQHNCAGGPTPWGEWLSCEEHPRGRVWACDPFGRSAPRALPALGVFQHEAAAVDQASGHVYLTEDRPDGRLYRFVPDPHSGGPRLGSGRLGVAEVDEETGRVRWHLVPRPVPRRGDEPTRKQVPESTAFNGGEGIWASEGAIHFATKGDNRVWRLDLSTQRLEVIYDHATAEPAVLEGCDNLIVTQGGEVLVAEDGGDMQLVLLDGRGGAAPFLQVEGQDHSEITGPAFSPDMRKLLFSSQRAPSGGRPLGCTYEVSGPFERLFGASV